MNVACAHTRCQHKHTSTRASGTRAAPGPTELRLADTGGTAKCKIERACVVGCATIDSMALLQRLQDETSLIDADEIATHEGGRRDEAGHDLTEDFLAGRPRLHIEYSISPHSSVPFAPVPPRPAPVADDDSVPLFECSTVRHCLQYWR